MSPVSLPLPAAVVDGRIIGILRGYCHQDAMERIGALNDAGLRCIEVAMGHPDSARTIAVARGTYPHLTLGAGTITSEASLRRAVGSGAQFLLSPNIDPGLIAMSVAHGVPFIAGGHTATECLAGMRAGASAIKVFPASTGGVGHIKALLQPFPELALVPTGGVSAENARSYLQSGAVAVGVGTSLTALDGADLAAAIRTINGVTKLDGSPS